MQALFSWGFAGKGQAVLKRYEETKTANEKAADEGIVHIGNAVFDMKKL